jgi:NAD-reducing hydrogenase large subunit
MKFPFFKSLGYPAGGYRVGPLGRLNASAGYATPKARQAMTEFKDFLNGEVMEGSLFYHYARVLELLYALERAESLLADEGILGLETRITSPLAEEEGVGVIEAPRGTLIHHYWVDRHGAMKKANLIVATGHNNLAMNQAIGVVAREYIKNGEVREGILNRMEGVIRCYDPCLSCATHTLEIQPPGGPTFTVTERAT